MGVNQRQKIINLSGSLSEEILASLVNWSLVDDTSEKIDQVTITFNAERFSSRPPDGGKYSISIHGQSRGEWSVIGSSVTINNVMTLKLSPVTKGSAIKQRETRAFNSVSIAEIVQTVVAAGGYTADVDPVIGAKVIITAQQNESAGVFLNRLANEYDAISKPYGFVWMFKPRLNTKTSKGNSKPTVFIRADTRLIDGTISHSADKAFNGVRVRYWDVDLGYMVVDQRGDSPYDDRGEVSKDKALDILNSYQNTNKSAQERANIIVPTSDPIVGNAFAEGVISINVNRFFRGDYVIDSVNMTPKQTTIQGSLPK